MWWRRERGWDRHWYWMLLQLDKREKTKWTYRWSDDLSLACQVWSYCNTTEIWYQIDRWNKNLLLWKKLKMWIKIRNHYITYMLLDITDIANIIWKKTFTKGKKITNVKGKTGEDLAGYSATPAGCYSSGMGQYWFIFLPSLSWIWGNAWECHFDIISFKNYWNNGDTFSWFPAA